MVDYREILRLASLKYSQLMIESSAGSSRHTINAVLTAAKNAEITWPLNENVTNAMLQATFFPEVCVHFEVRSARLQHHSPGISQTQRNADAAVGGVLQEGE